MAASRRHHQQRAVHSAHSFVYDAFQHTIVSVCRIVQRQALQCLVLVACIRDDEQRVLKGGLKVAQRERRRRGAARGAGPCSQSIAERDNNRSERGSGT